VELLSCIIQHTGPPQFYHFGLDVNKIWRTTACGIYSKKLLNSNFLFGNYQKKYETSFKNDTKLLKFKTKEFLNCEAKWQKYYKDNSDIVLTTPDFVYDFSKLNLEYIPHNIRCVGRYLYMHEARNHFVTIDLEQQTHSVFKVPEIEASSHMFISDNGLVCLNGTNTQDVIFNLHNQESLITADHPDSITCLSDDYIVMITTIDALQNDNEVHKFTIPHKLLDTTTLMPTITFDLVVHEREYALFSAPLQENLYGNLLMGITTRELFYCDIRVPTTTQRVKFSEASHFASDGDKVFVFDREEHCLYGVDLRNTTKFLMQERLSNRTIADVQLDVTGNRVLFTPNYDTSTFLMWDIRYNKEDPNFHHKFGVLHNVGCYTTFENRLFCASETQILGYF